jgi:hypothetical protein
MSTFNVIFTPSRTITLKNHQKGQTAFNFNEMNDADLDKKRENFSIFSSKLLKKKFEICLL